MKQERRKHFIAILKTFRIFLQSQIVNLHIFNNLYEFLYIYSVLNQNHIVN